MAWTKINERARDHPGTRSGATSDEIVNVTRELLQGLQDRDRRQQSADAPAQPQAHLRPTATVTSAAARTERFDSEFDRLPTHERSAYTRRKLWRLRRPTATRPRANTRHLGCDSGQRRG